MNVAIGHFLLLDAIQTILPGAALMMVLALPCRGPASSTKHLNSIRGQGSPTRLVKIVQIEILLLEPAQLGAVHGHLSLDIIEERGPHVTHLGGTHEDGLLVDMKSGAKCEGQLNMLDLRTDVMSLG